MMVAVKVWGRCSKGCAEAAVSRVGGRFIVMCHMFALSLSGQGLEGGSDTAAWTWGSGALRDADGLFVQPRHLERERYKKCFS